MATQQQRATAKPMADRKQPQQKFSKSKIIMWLNQMILTMILQFLQAALLCHTVVCLRQVRQNQMGNPVETASETVTRIILLSPLLRIQEF